MGDEAIQDLEIAKRSGQTAVLDHKNRFFVVNLNALNCDGTDKMLNGYEPNAPSFEG